jgi:hypothetical protein
MQIFCVGFVLLCINVHLKDGDLSPKHIELMSVDALRFYINRVHLLVYVSDYSHNARNE